MWNDLLNMAKRTKVEAAVYQSFVGLVQLDTKPDFDVATTILNQLTNLKRIEMKTSFTPFTSDYFSLLKAKTLRLETLAVLDGTTQWSYNKTSALEHATIWRESGYFKTLKVQ